MFNFQICLEFLKLFSVSNFGLKMFLFPFRFLFNFSNFFEKIVHVSKIVRNLKKLFPLSKNLHFIKKLPHFPKLFINSKNVRILNKMLWDLKNVRICLFWFSFFPLSFFCFKFFVFLFPFLIFFFIGFLIIFLFVSSFYFHFPEF